MVVCPASVWTGGGRRLRRFRLCRLAFLSDHHLVKKEWNPRIIYTTNSGFGPVGEWADKPSFDMIAQSFAGILVKQGGGPTKGDPERGLVDWTFSDEVGVRFSQRSCMGRF